MARPHPTDTPDVDPSVHIQAVREGVDLLIDDIDGRLRKLADGEARALLTDARARLGELSGALDGFTRPSAADKAQIEEALDDAGADGPAAGGGTPR